MLRLFLTVLCLAAPLTALAEERRLYVFGNSLVHHLTNTDETTVPHWLAQIARANGTAVRLDGQWGFLRNFAESPGQPNWSFASVPRAMGSFGGAGFDRVLITPANFIQYQNPDRPFDGDNPSGASPLSSALEVMDWTVAEGGPARFALYQGWAEMAPHIGGFPPWQRGLRRYHRVLTGEYDQWFVTWRDQLRAARPGYEIELIPVARRIGQIMAEEPFSDLTAMDLYLDADPHGTPTTYFIAALIVYDALWETPLPEEMALPRSIAPLVRDNYRLLRDRIIALREGERAGLTLHKIVPVQAAGPGPPRGLADPSLAMGLNGIADWSTQHPFIDVFKTARPWIGHNRGEWGGWEMEDLMAAGALSPEGWPIAIPRGVEALETFILTDQLPEALPQNSRWRVTYEGTGAIRIGGRASRISYDPGEIWFHYSAGEGPVSIRITGVDPADPIRNIAVVREEHIPLYEAGFLFNPDWLAVVEDLRVLRFMDWMDTNHSEVATWEDRPKLSDATYVWRGVPLPVLVELANHVGADPWFTMPHQADDGYVRAFAEEVARTLATERRVYVEYSNELWNFTFTQTHWAAEQANERWGDGAAPDQWFQFAGVRAAEVMALWSAALPSDRLVRVAGTHTDWIGLEEAFLEAPLSDIRPADHFDALAITGYFGISLGLEEEGLPQVREWMAEGVAAAEAAGQAEGLQRVALREYVTARRFDAVVPRVLDAAAVDLRRLTDVLFPAHAATAARYGYDLIMYEGGTHLVGVGAAQLDEDLAALFQAANYAPGMGDLYAQLLDGWTAAGGTLFNAFVDVSAPSRFGSWGHRRWLGDDNPRSVALAEANQSGTEEGDRGGAFHHGGIFEGTEGEDYLAGTTRGDVLLGFGGDDILVAAGGKDWLHGGAGTDRAVLPGAMADYGVERDGPRLILHAPSGEVVLFSVEEVAFSDAVVPANDL